jgi:hypothetical protein
MIISPQARKPRKTSGWSPERRAAQSAMMLARKIWLKSTGPRTAAGKARSSRNAVKHGKRTIEYTLLRAVMTNQKRLHHENATNELLNAGDSSMLHDAAMDGVHLMRLFLMPRIMQKSCFLPPPEADS